MEEWVKVYEEPASDEDGNFEDYRTWLNDILDDESIPYKMEARKEYVPMLPGLISNLEYVLEFYVYESELLRVKELIDNFKNSSFGEEYDELNVSEEDLNYED